MQVIFVLSPGDSMVLIRTIYEIAVSLKTQKNIDIIFYLSRIQKFSLLPHDLIEIRWIKNDLIAEEIPEADIILSTSAQLLINLSKLDRGELVYIKENKSESVDMPVKIREIDFDQLKPAVPIDFFHYQQSSKRDKIIIAGDNLCQDDLQQLFTAIEKVGSTIILDEIVILDIDQGLEPVSSLNFTIKNSEEINLLNLFENSFYFLWVNKGRYPLLAIWAMAAGVIVFNIDLGKVKQSFALQFNQMDPTEIALALVKSYKLGEYRKHIKNQLQEIVYQYKPELTAEIWGNYLNNLLTMAEQADSFITPLTGVAGGKTTVDLVIVNYNTLDYLKNCLESINKYTDIAFEIIVVDNGSTDGSKEYLHKKDNITLIDNKENKGYARACNQGILAGKGKYIILLNSDIEVTENWIHPLITAISAEDIAVVGPKLINKDEQIVGAGVDELSDHYQPRGWKVSNGPGVFDRQEEVLSVGGACYLLKRELLPVLGLFDEGYFFYFEELDYSLRAREKGYKVIYCPESTIYHLHEGSLQTGDVQGRMRRHCYFADSRKRFRGKWADLIAGGEKRREPKTIIVGGLIPWDFRQQRPQHILRNLAKEGYQILYLNPVCSNHNLQEVEDNIYVYSPPGYGTIIYNISHGKEIEMGRKIMSTVQELGFKHSILLLNAPYWLSLLKYWEYSLLVYDCIDNYTEFEDLVNYKEDIINWENKVLELADLVLTSSAGLYKEKKRRNDNTYLLPNGVDIEHFYSEYQPAEAPDDLPIGRKIIGYFGAIASWFDLDLVYKLARKLPEVDLVLIGEVSIDISKINALPNIYLLGEKPYSVLPDYLAFFQLAIIPFKRNKLTEMTDPVKLYEYLAGGKPVLAVDLPELEKYQDIIEIAVDEQEFIKKAQKMLNVKEVGAQERFNYIKGNTWLNRVNRLQELLHLAYYDLFLSDGLSDEQDANEDINEDINTVIDTKDIKGGMNKVSMEVGDLDQTINGGLARVETGLSEMESAQHQEGLTWLQRFKRWFGQSEED